MTKKKLTDKEITAAIAKLPEWKVVNGKLNRAFKFDSFVSAFAFMTKVAFAADKMDHHPEFTRCPTPEERAANGDMDYHTSFERKKRKLGLPIYRGLWQRR